MLRIIIPEQELYNEKENLFFKTKSQDLVLEHSLVSLSKWESKWQKPFLTKKGLTREETIDYIRCMTITQNVDPQIYNYITQDNLNTVRDYISEPMTATTFSKNDKKVTNEIITAEIIYYWMITFDIPFECQKWHLNKLLTLINVCSIKNQSPKKMSKQELLSRQRAINEARKSRIGTRG